MKREKRLTKREKKEQNGGGGGHEHTGHIHCIACGRHIDPEEFSAAPPSAMVITCQHKSQFAACTGCAPAACAKATPISWAWRQITWARKV